MFLEILGVLMENIVMINAIKEGKHTEIVSQDEIFEILKQ